MITAEIFYLKQRKEKPMNNDLISREALLEAIRTDVAPFTLSMVFRHIHSAPAVDAVEVVRCKDCIYAQERYGHLKCELGISISNTWNNPNMFCSYGERRADNG